MIKLCKYSCSYPVGLFPFLKDKNGKVVEPMDIPNGAEVFLQPTEVKHMLWLKTILDRHFTQWVVVLVENKLCLICHELFLENIEVIKQWN